MVSKLIEDGRKQFEEQMRRDATKRIARESLAKFVDAACQLLTAWEQMHPEDKAILDNGFPCCLPNFEEVPGILMAWREAVENAETKKVIG